MKNFRLISWGGIGIILSTTLIAARRSINCVWLFAMPYNRIGHAAFDYIFGKKL